MSYNDSNDVESLIQVIPTQPATPNLVRVPGIALAPEQSRATPIGVPVPPAASPDMTRVEGIAGNPQTAGVGNLNMPAPPSITSGTTGVLVGATVLSTATPIQPVAAPRIAGAQMVPPTPPATQTATQMTQAVGAPQQMQGISTLMQGS